MRDIDKKNPELGAVVVEFALVLPLLMFLLMGIIEFGLLFYNQQVLTNASREGARAGIAHLDSTEIEAIVKNYCEKRMIRFDSEKQPVPSVVGALGSYAEDLAVNVSYQYTFLVPQLFGFGPNLQLNAETVMSMENEEE